MKANDSCRMRVYNETPVLWGTEGGRVTARELGVPPGQLPHGAEDGLWLRGATGVIFFAYGEGPSTGWTYRSKLGHRLQVAPH